MNSLWFILIIGLVILLGFIIYSRNKVKGGGAGKQRRRDRDGVMKTKKEFRVEYGEVPDARGVKAFEREWNNAEGVDEKKWRLGRPAAAPESPVAPAAAAPESPAAAAPESPESPVAPESPESPESPAAAAAPSTVVEVRLDVDGIFKTDKEFKERYGEDNDTFGVKNYVREWNNAESTKKWRLVRPPAAAAAPGPPAAAAAAAAAPGPPAAVVEVRLDVDGIFKTDKEFKERYGEDNDTFGVKNYVREWNNAESTKKWVSPLSINIVAGNTDLDITISNQTPNSYHCDIITLLILEKLNQVEREKGIRKMHGPQVDNCDSKEMKSRSLDLYTSRTSYGTNIKGLIVVDANQSMEICKDRKQPGLNFICTNMANYESGRVTDTPFNAIRGIMPKKIKDVDFTFVNFKDPITININFEYLRVRWQWGSDWWVFGESDRYKSSSEVTTLKEACSNASKDIYILAATLAFQMESQRENVYLYTNDKSLAASTLMMGIPVIMPKREGERGLLLKYDILEPKTRFLDNLGA